MLEVDEKIALARAFSKRELRKYIDSNPVPVVESHTGELFVVDHHHFLAVCYHIGLKKVKIEIVKSFRKKRIGYAEFWKWMQKSRNMYPFCQFGEGPRKALYLPKDIRALADDPYRSLAWFVRKAGGFENSEKNFAEFKWANFFRSRRLLDREGMAGMAKALVKAVALSNTPAAKHLPGFGKLNNKEQSAVIENAKKKGKKLEARD